MTSSFKILCGQDSWNTQFFAMVLTKTQSFFDLGSDYSWAY